MQAIEVKMHYTTIGIFKFILEFGCKYMSIPHFIIMYLLSFFIEPLAFLLRNGIVHLIAYFIIATLFMLIFFLILAIIISIRLHSHKDHIYKFDEEKITHTCNDVVREYYYKQFKKVYLLKNYMYFKRILYFYITTDKFTDSEKRYIVKNINKSV